MSESMASLSGPSPSGERNEAPNWLELPRDVMATIVQRLGAIEILESAQRVCTTWQSICREPAMWRTVDMHNNAELHEMLLNRTVMTTVDCSCGQLVDINLQYFGTDELLHYIASCYN